jgi:dienelactone hydrolase
MLFAPWVQAQKSAPPSFDAARAFGARPSVIDMSLSPDGAALAYIAPLQGQASAVLTVGLEKGSKPLAALSATGRPDRLDQCSWLSDNRLICEIVGATDQGGNGVVPWSRLIPIDRDGDNFLTLGQHDKRAEPASARGGLLAVLPGGAGILLATHVQGGVGVDRVSTGTGQVTPVEPPDPAVTGYLADGSGAIRVKSTRQGTSFYRAIGSTDWKPLPEGFTPQAVDRGLNVVYGFRSHLSLYSVSLDGSLREQLLHERPDLGREASRASPIFIGHPAHLAGISYQGFPLPQNVYLTGDLGQQMEALSKALPGRNVQIVSSSADAEKLVIRAGSSEDPGAYFIFDRSTRHLDTFLAVRDPLEGAKLARVKPISYPASDDAVLQATLLLPPGREDARGLPAIVLPDMDEHAQDPTGFPWLAQFFASRGYAVIQPRHRGTERQARFRAWRVAAGDILAAGRWLVSQGIADPARLGIVGWGYAGYAALQAGSLEPGTFKAIIAIAPVTDLAALQALRGRDQDRAQLAETFGDGSSLQDTSPVMHADRIKVPVLLFHGTMDWDIPVAQSRTLADRLKAAGGRCELVTFDHVAHTLDDSQVRAAMLARSDAFLRTGFGTGK